MTSQQSNLGKVGVPQEASRGLFAKDLVILNSGRVKRTTIEIPPYLPNFHPTPTTEKRNRTFLEKACSRPSIKSKTAQLLAAVCTKGNHRPNGARAIKTSSGKSFPIHLEADGPRTKGPACQWVKQVIRKRGSGSQKMILAKQIRIRCNKSRLLTDSLDGSGRSKRGEVQFGTGNCLLLGADAGLIDVE
ncbi:hypothetical protein TNCV_523631 [Trichonephila clavipes]|nr:hypothetical protein TNCV_523631 [Trichonephila clavipes]